MSLTNLLSLLGTPHYHALCLVLAATAAIQALIAVWAATSRRHWFLRALVVWLAVMALVSIRAYEPALIFAFSSPLTAVFLTFLISGPLAARIPPGNTPAQGSPFAESPALFAIRFTLRDLFLLMIMAGLALSGVLHLLQKTRHLSFTNDVASIATLTLLTVGAWAVVHSRHVRASKLVFLVLLAACVSILPWILVVSSDYDAWQLLGVQFTPRATPGLRGIIPSTFWHDFRIVGLPLLEFSLLLIVFLVRVSSVSSLTSTSRRAATCLASVLVAILAILYCQMLFLTPLPPKFSDAPTSFDRLAEISSRLEDLKKAMNPVSSQPEQDALLNEALSLTAVANYIPFDPDDQKTWRLGDEDWVNRPAIRDLARAIDTAAVNAFAAGKEAEACELFRANIRLGTMLQRGSLIPDFLVGIAIHGLPLRSLAIYRSKLSSVHARQIIDAWQQALADCEATEAILHRDRATAERFYGWGCRLTNILDSWGLTSELYEYNSEWSARRRDTPIRLLQTDLAIRLYQRDRGALPSSLSDLVPQFLPALPIDPYSQKPLIYRPTTASDFLLYSVGLDGIDNGGNFTTAANYFARDYYGTFVTGYDHDLDSP